jgi:hypothetical protein
MVMYSSVLRHDSAAAGAGVITAPRNKRGISKRAYFIGLVIYNSYTEEDEIGFGFLPLLKVL